MTVQGYRTYEMTAKDTGKELKGITVFCSFEDKNITGQGVEKFSLSDEKRAGWVPTIGEEIEPIYNKYGKVDGIRGM